MRPNTSSSGEGLRGRILLACTVMLVALCFTGCAKPAADKTPPNPPEAAAPVTPPAPPPPAPVTPPKPAETAAAQATLPEHAQMPELEGIGWDSLFNGENMEGWKVTDFAGHGEVKVEDGKLIIGMGAMLTGVNGTHELPRTDYELALDVMKLEGSDFFCGLTFPIGQTNSTLILGGWGGGLVGISSVDGNDASMNETTGFLSFESKRWYRVRVKVTPQKVEAWVGKNKIINLKLEEKRMGMRAGEIEQNGPFGVATYQTSAALRNIQVRTLK